MFDLIKKTMLTGLGLAFLTKDKVEELAKEFVKKGKLSEKEGKEFIDELSKKSEDAKKEVEGKIEKVARDTMKKMNLVTRDDFLKLEKQLKQLVKAIKEGEAKD
ncbi:MAG: hypothetical protein JRI46_11620 [Deltaproteobacteria bacterium]|nr:hypothetical protein [Deltaproteobacteria bacterium]